MSTHVDPKTLIPDFDDFPGDIAYHEFPFWLGLTAECPVNQIDAAGLTFVKMTERIVKNDLTGKQVRVPVPGSLNFGVTRRQFLALREMLPRLVVRFTDGRPITQDASGHNIGDPIQRARRGQLIKIPTQEQVELAAKETRAVRPYITKPGDRPAAEFMYFVHVPDRDRGKDYETISEAGLVWPEDLAEINDLLS